MKKKKRQAACPLCRPYNPRSWQQISYFSHDLEFVTISKIKAPDISPGPTSDGKTHERGILARREVAM
jgi:hypothetical protein